MNPDLETQENEEISRQLRALPSPTLDARTEARMRRAVLDRIDQEESLPSWLFQPIWRSVLAAIVPFATGFAFGKSDFLDEAQMLIELEAPIMLATSIDTAHSLLDIFTTKSTVINVE